MDATSNRTRKGCIIVDHQIMRSMHVMENALIYFDLTNLSRHFVQDYKVVSREEAARNRYFGLGGWLLVFYLLAAIVFVMAVKELYLPPDPISLSIAHQGDVTALRASQILSVAYTLPLLLITPFKRPFVPKIWIGLQWLSWIAGFVSYTSASGQRNVASEFGLAATFTVALLLTWYFVNSKRVNVTYFNRVPTNQIGSGHSIMPARNGRLDSGPSTGTRVFWTIGGFLIFALILGLADRLFGIAGH